MNPHAVSIPTSSGTRTGLLFLLILLFVTAPAIAAPDSTVVTRTMIRTALLHSMLTLPDAGRTGFQNPTLPALQIGLQPSLSYSGMTAGPSPLDTLHMSPLEKIFWGRRGLFRATGLFKTDQEMPANDLRSISKLRRKMLKYHQALGLVTVASMAVTVIGGERAYDGKGSSLHTTSLPFTIGLYSTAAVLALSSPPKLLRGSGGIDTITFHKVFAVFHLAGMLITPMLAPDSPVGDSADIHRILGYSTFAAFSAGMLIVTFFR